MSKVNGINMTERRKVAVVRGKNLNEFEMQAYEPLMKWFDLTAFAGLRQLHRSNNLSIPVRRLFSPGDAIGLLPGRLRAYADAALGRMFGFDDSMWGMQRALAGFDIVHSSDVHNMYSMQAGLAARRNGARFVVTQWENIPFVRDDHPVYRRVKSRTLALADKIVAVTERARQALLLEGVPRERIVVIPSGIDTRRFTPQPKNRAWLRALGLPDDAFYILYVGKMIYSKGVHNLIGAVARLIADPDLVNVPVRLLLVGDGPGRRRLAGLASRLGISSSVRILGSIDYASMPLVYGAADIFVLPSLPVRSWQEQFGVVLVEAMASGRPIISTLSGSIPDVVGDAGVLVQPGDHWSLYQGMKMLVLDESARQRLGRAARRRAEAMFDARIVSDQMRQLYDDLLS